jgi:6-phosphogluconolactonase/glucosamine-6-phosphate isomerase/deaminase
LRTILEARLILLMATGGRKAPYVKRLIEGPYDPMHFPAHYLAEAQGEVIIFLDEAAASQVSF